MSGFEELHLEPAVGAALESFGYAAGDAAVRDQAPTAARGHNLALACPPSARYAVPALAGLVSTMAREHRPGLVLAPAAALTEWSAVLLPLCEAAGIPFLASDLPVRATRLLREGRLRLLLTTPDTALTLRQRSVLKLEEIGHLVLAWPELYENEEALAALMQDLPQESQRILIPVAPRAAHPLAERYVRRAHVTGPLQASTPTSTAVRGAVVPLSQRSSALASLIETEDPARLVVWCVDARSAADARASLPASGDTMSVVSGDTPTADLIVAWDLPTPARLAELREKGEVVLLVPPHALSYTATLATRLTPVRIHGSVDAARDRTTRNRAAIEELVRHGGLDAELLMLDPLFERHDPATIAAATYRLWQAMPAAAPAATTETGAARREGGSVARVWIGVGRKDGAGPNDIMAALTREAGVAAGAIGRIEIREMFSLVEVPAAEAEEIARNIAGKTVRRRTVNARVDRGGSGEKTGSRAAGPRTRRPAH
ncbi:MAG: DbpA RNA binding domain-containing protein [Gemmatimonadota bacterium]|nr:DbpA RNA binding domain-containing protein [Gemmatimonadota bacterium]